MSDSNIKQLTAERLAKMAAWAEAQRKQKESSEAPTVSVGDVEERLKQDECEVDELPEPESEQARIAFAKSTEAKTDEASKETDEAAPSAEEEKLSTKQKEWHLGKMFQRNDSGNADLFVELYGGKVLFDRDRKRWLLWDENDSRWREDKMGKVREMMKNVADFRVKRALKWNASTPALLAEQNKELKFAAGSRNLPKILSALGAAETLPGIGTLGNDWDAEPMLFGVANGVVDLRTAEFRKCTPADRITKFSPVAYDRDAKCPRWEQFLSEIFPNDEEHVAYMQRAIGYSMTSSIKEECFFGQIGAGGNGKSKFNDTVKYVLGDYGVPVPMEELTVSRHDIGFGANLPGSRAAFSAEVDKVVTLNVGRIKALTGEQEVSIRLMRTDWFSFPITHKHWIAFNHKPIIRDDTHSMWRRVHLIPFEQKFEGKQRDFDLLGKLKAEGSGILNWMIAGCLAWQRKGLEMSATVRKATAKYQVEQDSFGTFIEERCEVAAGFIETPTRLFAAQKIYFEMEKSPALNRLELADALRKRGFKNGEGRLRRHWIGLRLVGDTTRALGDTTFDDENEAQVDDSDSVTETVN